MRSPIGRAADVQRRHLQAIGLHRGGALGIGRRSPHVLCQARDFTHGRQGEDIFLQRLIPAETRRGPGGRPAWSRRSSPSAVSRRRAEGPHGPDVAFPERLGQLGRLADGIASWLAGAVALPPPAVRAGPAVPREAVSRSRRVVERRRRQPLPTGRASLPGNHVRRDDPSDATSHPPPRQVGRAKITRGDYAVRCGASFGGLGLLTDQNNSRPKQVRLP